MRDMANLYHKLPTDSLKVLRSKKVVRLQKLEAEHRSFFVKQELEAVQYQIHQIDVELTARFLLMKLL